MNHVFKEINSRNIFLLVFGGTLSYLGDLLYLMALNIWISRVTNSPATLGEIMAIGSFALFIGNPIGGILADKYSKRKLLIVTDILSGLAVGVTYLLYNSSSVPFLPVVLSNIVLSFCFSVYSPTSRAITPFVTSGDGIRKLNLLMSISGEVTKLASPAIGGFLLSYNFLGEKSLILMNSGSFMISAILNYYLVLNVGEKTNEGKHLLYELKNLLSGYKEVWEKMEEIRTILLPISLVNFFSGGLHVLLPFLDLTKDKSIYPKLLLAEAIGAVAGGVLSSKMSEDLSWTKSQLLLIFAGLSMIGLHSSLPTYVHFILLFLFGFSIALFNINFFTVVQKHADEKYIGRVFGLIFTVISALVPVGNLFFSKIEVLNPGIGIVIAGTGMVISVLSIMLYTRTKNY